MSKKPFVAIIGKTGYVSRELCSYLRNQGTYDSVQIDSRLDASQILGKVKALSSDLAGIVLASGAGVTRRADAMLQYNHQEFVETGTLLSQRLDCAIVALGSCFEYGLTGNYEDFLSPDTSELRPAEPYGISKAKGYERLLTSGFFENKRATYARVFQAWGGTEDSHRLYPALTSAKARKKKIDILESEVVRDFIYVQEVAAEIMRLITDSSVQGGTKNISSGVGMTVREFAVGQNLDTYANFHNMGQHPYKRLVGESSSK